MKPRLLFMGSPAIAVPSLKFLLENGYPIVGVVSQPDQPAGRGQKIEPCAVAEFAREANLPLFQPGGLKGPEVLKTLKSFSPDLILLVAYGKILPREILEIPKHCVNLHFSLLPKYRGAAPVQWALIHGEEETGVTTMLMVEKLDAGPILMQKRVVIEPDETAEGLGQRLANSGAHLLIETIGLLEKGDFHPTPQNESDATLARSLKKEDGRLDFSNRATMVLNRIRGVTPWPGAFTRFQGKILKVHRAVVSESGRKGASGEILHLGPKGIEVACGQGSLFFEEVQLEGKKRLSAVDFAHGSRLEVGMRLE
ncbi:MAG: methionyl-tRNA formyltransferase [Deltaproteobacteria bacterium]|nr:methionyl-tRNA formyltransferase [Deltaproteobacteria bacterium]MBI4374792.1 methionyl-tRNA formyltransferase [Deltaproteobacteria bacterium]